MIYINPANNLKDIVHTKHNFLNLRIAWLFPENDLPTNPSARLRRFQISTFLSGLYNTVKSDNIFYYHQMDIKSQILSYDVVVIFSINEYDKDLCKFLKDHDKIVIFDHCENIWGLGYEDEIMEKCTAITCCSVYLAELTDKYLSGKGIQKPVFVIRDPIDDICLDAGLPTDGHNLDHDVALVMGMGGNAKYTMSFLSEICKITSYSVMLITENIHEARFWDCQYEIWSPYSWVKQAQSCSVALCYHDINTFPAKGNVKVSMPMALGLPVIASPLASYIEAIEHGTSGFIARNKNEWVNYLWELKNGFRRLNMGLNARNSSVSNYRTSVIGLDYLFMVNSLRLRQKERSKL